MNNSALIQVKRENKLGFYFSIISTLLFFVVLKFDFVSSIGVGLSIYIFIRFIIMLGHNIPVIELMLLIASSQWIIGPLIDYKTKIDNYKMYMYVPEETYMDITVPLFFSFALSSLFLYKTKLIDLEVIKRKINTNKLIPLLLIILGVMFTFISSILPISFLFIGFIIKNFTIVGIGLLLLNNYSLKTKLIICTLAILPQTYQSISSGMFHVLIIWLTFIFIFFNFIYKLSFAKKIIIISIGILFLSVLQLIKKDFRKTILSSENSNKIEVFIDMLFNSESIEQIQNDDEINSINSRLNQGWIISKIYDRIPKKKPFYNGETIENAFEALIPRILYPEKKITGGGKETFELLTGIILSDQTAMGTSLLGEFYGNYGVWGGILAFLIWGFLLHSVVSIIYKYHLYNPLLYFFLPIIFFQVIKAETDLTTVLNHLVKSIVIIVITIYLIKKLLVVKA